MKVAVITDTYLPYVNGVATHAATLRDGLIAAGHEVLVVTVNPKYKQHVLRDGVLYCPAVPIKKIYGYGITAPLTPERMRYLKDFDPDILHLHTEFSMGLFALYAHSQLKVPLVYTLHTMYDDYVYYVVPRRMDKMTQPLVHAYIRRIAAKAAQLIGPSKKVAEYFRACGVEKPVNVVPNSVDTDTFRRENVTRAKVAALQKQLQISENDIALCFVGRLGKEKSVDVTIEYFTKAFKGEERFKLFIIGTGPDKDDLAAQVRALGMERQIMLLGRVEHADIPPYYQACHLFTTASLTEMNSISLLEATASGLYAVTRLDPNNTDQIISGQNGEVYTSPKEFEAHIRRYAALPQAEKIALRAQVEKHAVKYGRSEFIIKILNVYIRALLNNGKRGIFTFLPSKNHTPKPE